MADYDLRTLQHNAAQYLEFHRHLITFQLDWREFRKLAKETCDHLLTLASSALLVQLNTEMFFQNLHRSAANWQRYLVSFPAHYTKQPTLTYNAPLFAAIISKDQHLLNNIKQNMPTNHLDGEEYPNHFYVTWLYLELALNGCTQSERIASLLQSLESIDAESPHLELFKGLLGMDDLVETDYWGFFESAHFQHDEAVLEKVSMFTTKIDEFAAHRHIWFEGIVLLLFSLAKGFTIPSSNIKYCPNETLTKMNIKYRNDWLMVPQAEPMT